MSARTVFAVLGALALVSVAACGSSGGGAAAPTVTQTVVAPAPATTTKAPIIINNNNNAAPTPTQTVVSPVYVAQPGVTDPWAVISEYYGLIESGQYLAAWDLGSQSFMDQNGDNFPAWEAGYVNTGAQTLSEISESGDTVYINLSAVDTATGTTQYFTGWFTVDGGLITSGSMTQTG